MEQHAWAADPAGAGTLRTRQNHDRPLSRIALILAALLAAPLAQAQAQHAHVHGVLKLDVAVDGRTLTIAIDSPLDNVVGFERAPRSDAEKKTVAEAVAQLRAADRLFVIDPAAGCKLDQIDLDAPALGLGQPNADAPSGHADLEGTFSFQCNDATKARFIDVGFFKAFRNTRQIDVQIASPQGQFKRTLKQPVGRLAWGP